MDPGTYRIEVNDCQSVVLFACSLTVMKSHFETVCANVDARGKIVLALDEYQWMVESSPELPSVLQQLWDMQSSKAGSMVLLLCGSYIGFMEREVLGAKSPLYGRRTGQILLKPFSFIESGLFHPGYSLEDKARIYFLCGGIPLYMRFFNQNRSVEMNIRECFLDEYAALYREAEFLLREEFKDVGHYYSSRSGC